MEWRASSRYLRGSAQKARLVVDMIRGKNVNDALAVLRFTSKRAADPVEKCVRSAIANATEAAEKQNVVVDPDDLWIKAAFVDMGPTKHRRRVRPAPQGRAYREQRHFCHVTVLLSSEERAAKESAARGTRKAQAGPKKGGTGAATDSTSGVSKKRDAKRGSDKAKTVKAAAPTQDAAAAETTQE